MTYAVPLQELVDAVRVTAAQQVCEQAAARTQHLPGEPFLWQPDGSAAGGGGASGCADGDC